MPDWVKEQIDMDDYVDYLKAPVGTWDGKTYRVRCKLRVQDHGKQKVFVSGKCSSQKGTAAGSATLVKKGSRYFGNGSGAAQFGNGRISMRPRGNRMSFSIRGSKGRLSVSLRKSR